MLRGASVTIVWFLLVTLGVSVAVGDSRAEGAAAPPLIEEMFSPDDPVVAEAVARSERESARRERIFQSPAAEARRAESEDAYADVADGAALALARETFPEELSGPAEVGLGSLSRGLEVRKYTSQFSAQVETATGEPYGLLESAAPLTTDASADTPIDLSLTRVQGGFVPKRSGVDVELPGDSSNPASLDGISFTPATTAQAMATEHEDRLYYPSIDVDTDYVLQATELGVEAYWQLRSVDSPETLRLHYSLPEGSTLQRRVAPGGADSVAVVRDGVQIGIVKPVSAVDAADRGVQASMSVDGHDIVVTVRHRNAGVEYPVLVDPVSESWTSAQFNWPTPCGAGSPAGEWTVYQEGGVAPSNTYRACADFVGIGSYAGRWYPAGTGMNLAAPVSRPYTYISDIYWTAKVSNQAGATAGTPPGSTSYFGLYSESCGKWQTLAQVTWYFASGTLYQNTKGDSCQNRPIMGMWFNSGATSAGQYTLASAVTTYVTDTQGPDAPVLVSSSPAATNVSGKLVIPWSSNPSVSLSTRDFGLGTYAVGVLTPNGQSWLWGPYWFSPSGGELSAAASSCTGTHANPCPTWTVSTNPHPFQGLADARTDGQLVAIDAGGRLTAGATLEIRRDTVKPARPTLTGGLVDADGLIFPDQPYDLQTVSSDSTSGVNKIHIYVDGVEQDAPASRPTCDGCNLTRYWSLNPAGMSGTHSVTVSAEDFAGNLSDPATLSLEVSNVAPADLSTTHASVSEEPWVDNPPNSEGAIELATCNPAEVSEPTQECDFIGTDNVLDEALRSDASLASGLANPLLAGDVVPSSVQCAQARGSGPSPCLARGGSGWAIADNNPDVWTKTVDNDPNSSYQLMAATKVARARIVVPWDIVNRAFRSPGNYVVYETSEPNVGVSLGGDRGALRTLDQWIANVIPCSGMRFEPLITFEHSRPATGPLDVQALPTLDQYEYAMRRFLNRYNNKRCGGTQKIRLFTSWNEPNEFTQPMVLHEKRAGEYWRRLDYLCHKEGYGCTVIAGEFTFNPRTFTALREFKKGMNVKESLVPAWSIHGYSIANKATDDYGTALATLNKFLTKVEGKVWITETGGVRTLRGNGRSLQRAEQDYCSGLRLARSSDRITRFYTFELRSSIWRFGPSSDPAARSNQFDSGLNGYPHDNRSFYNNFKYYSANNVGDTLRCP